MENHTNSLIHASSPYLLQHAHNPVNWVEWSKEAFEQAKRENKLVLISVGYSACHWCHVMERESFMSEEVAKIMNENLICIKVDREERPDVDQLYMTAVQLMKQQGGWPLNCFTLPDGRPIYGGTYFPKENWKQIILQLSDLFKNKPATVLEYAQQIEEGIATANRIIPNTIEESFDSKVLELAIQNWKKRFDFDDGGDNRAPKFLMPNNIELLLRYGVQYQDQTCLQHAHRTLQKIAFGGIYDQIGGGFSRYSVDAYWKVPHFEKMLYDNAQMLSIYAHAYQQSPSAVYKETIKQTISWLQREMLDKEGGFYSAIDADSEGEEGKFYVWKEEELKTILEEEYSWFSKYFNVNDKGYWENGNYILLRSSDFETFCEEQQLDKKKYTIKLTQAIKKLLHKRNSRVRPSTDDKMLTSWNAMTIVGLIDAGKALQNKDYIDLAIQNGNWILKNQLNPKTGELFRTRKDGKSKINGFLEDYAHVINAFIHLYEITFDDKWFENAKNLTAFTRKEFYDSQTKMFFFTGKNCELLVKKFEIEDNVIPASNSVMANNLFKLGKLLDDSELEEMAKQMLSNIYEDISDYLPAYSNWGMLAINFINNYFEIAVLGDDASGKAFTMGSYYIPNALFAGGESLIIPMLKDKKGTKEVRIYVCQKNACLSPTPSIQEAIELIRNSN